MSGQEQGSALCRNERQNSSPAHQGQQPTSPAHQGQPPASPAHQGQPPANPAHPAQQPASPEFPSQKNANLIRDKNLRLLRRIMNEERTATKARLAELSGLSVVAVQSLLKVLIYHGEIQEEGTVKPSHGRPSAVYRYNEQARLLLSVCMYEKDSADTAVYSVYNLLGHAIETREVRLTDPKVDSLDPMMRELIGLYPAICAIGIGLPGEEVEGRLIASDYEGMQGAALCGHIEETFGVPAFVENDVNAAVAGYCGRQQAGTGDTAAAVYLPKKYGPGVGVWINGALMKGRNGLVGEVACLPLGFDWLSESSPQERLDCLARIAQVCILMYNPHRLVIYGQVPQQQFMELLEGLMCSPMERLMMPEIDFSDDLRSDFEAGIRNEGLKWIKNY